MKLNELFELYLEDIDLTHQDTTLDSIRYVYNSGLAKKYGNKKLESIKFKEIKKYQKELLNGKHKTKDGKTYRDKGDTIMKGKRNEKRSKKSAILKQHARNLFVGVVIVLFVSMSFSAFFVSAKEKDTPDHESTYIYYKSIKIEKGDTLWDIANENLPEKYSSTEEYVKVLKEINGLSSDKIYSGENLMIMYMTE